MQDNKDNQLQSSFFKRQSQAAPQKQMREFTVGDEFLDDEAEHEQFEKDKTFQMRQQKIQENVTKVSEAGKKRIEYLLGIGSVYRDVKVGQTTFTLRSLKSKEFVDVNKAAIKNATTDIELALELRKNELARSVVKIDGISVEDILGLQTNNPIEILNAKLNLIDELSESVVKRLNNEFNILTKETTEMFEIKNESQAKELGNDIKK